MTDQDTRVTDAMIEAGIAAFHRSGDRAVGTVCAIYLAMHEARSPDPEAAKLEWQGIESALKDGRSIIGRDRYGNVFDCRFVTGDYFAGADGGDPCDYQDGWYRVNDDSDEVCPHFWLPAPPVQARQEGE